MTYINSDNYSYFVETCFDLNYDERPNYANLSDALF